MSLFADLLLPLYADGHLPRPLRRWLRGRLRTDEALRASYEGQRRLDRTGEHALSAAQMRLVLQAILDDVVVASSPPLKIMSSSTTLLTSALLAMALTATLFFSGGLEGLETRGPSPELSMSSRLSSTTSV